MQAVRNRRIRAMTRRLVDETDRVLIAKPPGTFKMFVPFIIGSLGAREEENAKIRAKWPTIHPKIAIKTKDIRKAYYCARTVAIHVYRKSLGCALGSQPSSCLKS